MKFYDCATAPSPRVVRIMLAEKGVEMETVEVDLRNGEHLGDEFRVLNPWCTVPVIELDDGTAISEINACCRFIEETWPEPALMGTDARDRAIVTMWHHRVEIDGFMAVAEAFRNSTKRMGSRALTGPLDHAQIPELAERGRKRVAHMYEWLDVRLGAAEFIAGDRFSIADIAALVTIDFAGWIKLGPNDDQTNVKCWYAAAAARPGIAG